MGKKKKKRAADTIGGTNSTKPCKKVNGESRDGAKLRSKNFHRYHGRPSSRLGKEKSM